jgi:hypothetical protein
MGERWYWRTFWTLVMAVLVAGGIVWLVNSHTNIGPNTASISRRSGHQRHHRR